MLQQVRHPNIVLFYGAGTTPEGTPFLVLELVEFGTLTSYLETNSSIPWLSKISFALDTARGMAYVHERLHRIHRDLKSLNLLVGANLQIKVADFGTAVITNLGSPSAQPSGESALASHHENNRVHTQRTKGVGTPLWMAPEILQGSKSYTLSAEVYSYGIVLWEIAAQEKPWNEVSEQGFFLDVLLKLILSGQRPRVNATWPPAYCELMAQCWATNAEARPLFGVIVDALELLCSSAADGAQSQDLSSILSSSQLISLDFKLRVVRSNIV